MSKRHIEASRWENFASDTRPLQLLTYAELEERLSILDSMADLRRPMEQALNSVCDVWDIEAELMARTIVSDETH